MFITSYDPGGFGGRPWKSRADLAALVTDVLVVKKEILCCKKNTSLLISDLFVLCMRERDFAGFCMDVSIKHFLYSQFKDSYCL